MLGIFTSENDAHADVVVSLLDERGAAYVRLDPGKFPAEATLSARFKETEFLATFTSGGETVDLTGLQVVWWRRPSPPSVDSALDAPVGRAVREEAAVVLADLWNALPCSWVPASPAVLSAAHKINQLALAAKGGFQIPATAVTNDPLDLFDLYRESEGAVVSKRAGASFLSGPESPFCRYTEVIAPREIGYAFAARYAPSIFQTYVAKRSELRVTIVGERVFAVEIDSQASNHTRHDWRRYDQMHARYRAHQLPEKVEARCRELVHRLGLSFAALDLILTPAGEYVFVELNPNGQYLWLEHATGIPISSAVCDLLIELDRRTPPRSPDAA